MPRDSRATRNRTAHLPHFDPPIMATATPPLQPLVLGEQDAAAALGLSPVTLAKMRYKGGGPEFISLTGRRVGYTLAALQAFVDSRPSHRSTSDGRPAGPTRGKRTPKG